MDMSLCELQELAMGREAWRWAGRPGVLRFMGRQRVRQDWATELKLLNLWYLAIHKKKSNTIQRRRQWQPTLVLLLGKSHGWRSLLGCGPWAAMSPTLLSDFTFHFVHWRRKRQHTPIFLPGESQGQGSLVGCRLWGRTRVGHNRSDLAAATAIQPQNFHFSDEESKAARATLQRSKT